MDRDRRLSRQEFDEVIRRATEMAAQDSESTDLTEGELYRIAGEVGLPESHVRRALVELRTGGLPEVQGEASGVERLFGPETIRAARVVPGTCAELARKIDAFFGGGQLLQRVRQSRNHLQYRPSIDWVSQIARAASSTSRRYYTASAESVEVRLDELPDEKGRVLVEIQVDPGTRGEAVLGASLGGGLGGAGLGVGAGFLVATAAPVAVAVAAGVVAAGGFGAGMTWLIGRSHRRKVADVRAEVEGILDRLEMGESLDPPPPSWRKWVERQFHGARKIMEDYSGTSPDTDFDDFGRGP